MSPQSEHEQAVRKLAELIGDIRIAMLTTLTEDGTLRSRPLLTQSARFDGDLWFITRRGSGKVEEMRQHQQVCLTYARIHDNTYVSVSGTAEVVSDARKARDLWDPSYESWFPEGPTDPDLVLVRVRIDQAEYWDAPSYTWPFSAGFVVMGPEQMGRPESHAKIILKKG
jgi:general stress protein 26